MKPLMTSLDLFSGVGGITRALEGFARPIAYCEIDKDCQEVLKVRMEDGSLPKANIYDDVRKLNAKTLKVTAVDMIVGGWPCQDLSAMGLKKGLAGAKSGLIYEVFRLTDELNPKMLLLENVPLILKNGFDVLLEEFVVKRNYELRWANISASSVGALHVRKRWFGLLIKKGTKLPLDWGGHSYKPAFTNMVKEGVPRMVDPTVKAERADMNKRAAMLGNSVVPDAVRFAFLTLLSGFKWSVRSVKSPVHTAPLLDIPTSIKYMPSMKLHGKAYRPTPSQSGPPRWGYALPGSNIMYKVKRPRLAKPRLALVFDPKLFKGMAKGKLSSELVKKQVHCKVWNTPRFTSHTSNVLTKRALRDLPSQLRYEINTPNHLRKGIIHPRFVEWLMGYPLDYTKRK